MNLLRVLLVVVVVGPGCGGSEGAGGADLASTSGDGGAPGGEVLPGDWARAQAEANCRWRARCGIAGASEVPVCTTALLALGGNPRPYSERDAVAAGRLSWNPAAAARCLDSLAGAPCAGQPYTNAPDCNEVRTGRVALGGLCLSDAECTSGNCDTGGGLSLDGCGGTCQPRKATGARCSKPTDCSPTDYCDESSFVCTRRVPLGGACSQPPAREFDPCEPGSICGGGENFASNHCVKPFSGMRDTPCTYQVGGIECARGLYCNQFKATCQPRAEDGAPCLARGGCREGSSCVWNGAPMGTCAPTVDVGHACEPAAQAPACADDLLCDPATARCVARAATAGMACTSSQECNPFTTELCLGGVCTPDLHLGDACTPPKPGQFDRCPSRTQCDPMNNRCVLRCG